MQHLVHLNPVVLRTLVWFVGEGENKIIMHELKQPSWDHLSEVGFSPLVRKPDCNSLEVSIWAEFQPQHVVWSVQLKSKA